MTIPAQLHALTLCLSLLAGCSALPKWVPDKASARSDTTATSVASQEPTDIGAVAAKPTDSQLPLDWSRGVFMEIFVRGYQDSDGDGVGDLRGLINRLDYLQELGVTGLWLMPVTQSQDRDHGYATRHYRSIEKDYGSLADFDELLRQAHARGIGIVIDYLVNHGSYAHATFQQAKTGPGNAFRDWYIWSPEAPQGWLIWDKDPWYWTGGQPWLHKGEVKDLPKPAPGAKDFYFGTFGPHMPDFNLRNPDVVQWHEDNLRFWLNRGLDGFRLDAVPHLIENNAKDWNDQPESRALTQRFYKLISSYPNRFTVCEATAEPAAYSRDDVCGSAFAFGLEHAILQALKEEAPDAVQRIGDFFKTRPHRMGTMLANHDIFAGQRIWDQLKGDEARYKLAAASYLLQPGIPFIYYGEEVGMAGNLQLPGDEPIRGPMSWDGSKPNAGFSTAKLTFRPTSPNATTHNALVQKATPGSLWHHYKALIALRKSHTALQSGSYEAVQVDGPVLSFVRRTGNDAVLVALNYSGRAAQLQRSERLDALAFANPAEPNTTLAPWGVKVWTLKP